MSEQHYAPPRADLNSLSNDISMILEPLRATKGWAKLCSIVGFISCGFMVLAALGMMVGGAAFEGTAMGGGMGAGVGFGVGIFYLLFSLLYFFPSLFLLRYSNRINTALMSQNPADIADALTQQKSFWKFAGIVVLIMLAFMVLGMISAIIIPLAAM